MASVKKELMGTANQTAELLQEFSFQPGEEYQITVVASNAIGNSSESNPVSFSAPTNGSAMMTSAPTNGSATMTHFEPLLYIPIIVSGAAIAFVILLVVVFVTGYLYKSEFCSHGAYVGAKLLCELLTIQLDHYKTWYVFDK